MKRIGFTLAEVLVTLGIIGTVAAITAPALIQHVGSARVGPRLQKAKTTFENSVQLMLVERGVPGLNNVGRSVTTNDEEEVEITDHSGVTRVLKLLTRYMKATLNDSVAEGTGAATDASYTIKNRGSNNDLFVSSADGNRSFYRMDMDDGVTLWVQIGDTQAPSNDYEDIPNNQLVGTVIMDINGQAAPNEQSKDAFEFWLYNDGTLRPYGSARACRKANATANETATWQAGNCDSSGVNNASTCTGSIFENDLKVIYD